MRRLRLQALRGHNSCGIGKNTWISLALFAAFLLLYSRSIDLFAANVLGHNFLFDADVDRVVHDAVNGQNETVFRRHPLFALVFAWPASMSTAPIAAIRMLVAVSGAAGVVVAHSVFRRLIRDRAAALAFAVMYGSSGTVWLLGSIPETFALNAAAIGLCFAVRDPLPGRGTQALRFLGFAVAAALAIGVTVTNAVYFMLAYGAALVANRSRLAAGAWSAAAFVAAASLFFVFFSAVQRLLLPGHVPPGAWLVNPFVAARGDGFFDLSRAISAHDILLTLRAFLVDNVVPPDPAVAVVDTVDGPTQMLQFWEGVPRYWFGVAALFLPLALGFPRSLGRVVRAREGRLALAFIAWNLVLHYFYRANGQPFIFAIHTVLAVLVVVAAAASVGQGRGKLVLGLTAAFAIAFDGAVFVIRVREALAIRCERRVDPLVCLTWASDDPRFAHGIETYRASASYLSAAGNNAFERSGFESAEDFYEKSLAREPRSAPVERQLGITLLFLGRREEALIHLNNAVKLDPGDIAARQAIARLER